MTRPSWRAFGRPPPNARPFAPQARSDGRGLSASVSMWVGCWPRAYLLQSGNTRCYRFAWPPRSRYTDDVGDLVFGQSSSLVPGSGVNSSVVFRLANSWGTVILLCTDELTKYVADSQIRERLSSVTSAQQTCQDLVHDAVAAGATGSLTMILGRARPVMRTRRVGIQPTTRHQHWVVGDWGTQASSDPLHRAR